MEREERGREREEREERERETKIIFLSSDIDMINNTQNNFVVQNL
jgi:hypothetical protein